MKPVYLVGVDGSNCSSRAINYARERAQASGGRILVAHVIEWSQYSFSTPQENEERHKRREEELQRASEGIVDPIVSSLRDEGLDAEGLIRHGHAAETLAALASEHDVTCIIIGRRGLSKLKAKIFGSVASNLVQISDRPVSVVP
jgi:nucleotide-binding universal stress UspA family protein